MTVYNPYGKICTGFIFASNVLKILYFGIKICYNCEEVIRILSKFKKYFAD